MRQTIKRFRYYCDQHPFCVGLRAIVRHVKWKKASQPLGHICWNSNKAIIKHFADGKY